LQAELRAESDLDLLVEFHDGVRIGWIGMSKLEFELAELFGRRIDLRTGGDLSRYFRDDVCATAEVLYWRKR